MGLVFNDYDSDGAAYTYNGGSGVDTSLLSLHLCYCSPSFIHDGGDRFSVWMDCIETIMHIEITHS